jgi:hypothetical protein
MAFYSMLHSNQEESLTSSFRGFHDIHAHVMVSVQNEMENVQQHWKLPFIIGTEEFARDSECGLADFTFVGAYSRSGTPESDSDTERDEAQMAAEMVGTGILSEGEWSAIESEGSAHQVPTICQSYSMNGLFVHKRK